MIDSYSDIKEIIINLKKYFSKNLRREFFLTLTLASIEKDGTIKLVRAGHPPSFHYKSQSKEFVSVSPYGLGIGLNDKGIFEKTLEEYTFKPSKDDIVVLYSDGITEAMNMYHDLFGEENLKRVIGNSAEKSPEEIKDLILRAVIAFRGQANQNDDLTMVVLKANLRNIT